MKRERSKHPDQAHTYTAVFQGEKERKKKVKKKNYYLLINIIAAHAGIAFGTSGRWQHPIGPFQGCRTSVTCNLFGTEETHFLGKERNGGYLRVICQDAETAANSQRVKDSLSSSSPSLPVCSTLQRKR